jgi:hypothetical protein
MIINYHKINLGIWRNIFWVPKSLILKWPYRWILDLRLILHLRLLKSPMDHFEMNLHASIAYRFWSSFKGHPNYILIILKWVYMSVLHLRLGLHLKLPKSPMGYIKTDSNMGITFRVRYSYNFAIPAHVLIFTN